MSTVLADTYVSVTAEWADLLAGAQEAAQQAGSVLDDALTAAGASGGQNAADAASTALGQMQLPLDQLQSSLVDAVQTGAATAGDALTAQLTAAGAEGGGNAAAAASEALNTLTVNPETISAGIAAGGADGAASVQQAVEGLSPSAEGLRSAVEGALTAGGDAGAADVTAAMDAAAVDSAGAVSGQLSSALSGVADTASADLAAGIEEGAKTGGEQGSNLLSGLFGAAGERASEAFGDGFGAVAAKIGTGFGLAELFASGLGEVEAFQATTAQTVVRLQDMGQQAGVTAEQVRQMAEELSHVAGINPNAIASAENFLLTLGNIRDQVGEGNNIFDRAIKDSQDLAVALGVDLGTAAQRLGRMLNDPVQGMNTLTRAGLTFTAEQKDQIKAMVAVGDTLGAQRLILDEVERRYRGAADAFGNTLPGQLAKAKVSFEQLAGSILQVVTPALVPLAADLSKLAQDIGPAVSVVMGTVGHVIGDVAAAVGGLIGFLGDHEEVVVAFGAAMAAAFGPALLEAAVATTAAVLLKLGQITTAAQGMWTALAANPEALAALAGVAALVGAYEALTSSISAAWDAAANAVNRNAPAIDPTKVESYALAVADYTNTINSSVRNLKDLGASAEDIANPLHAALSETTSQFTGGSKEAALYYGRLEEARTGLHNLQLAAAEVGHDFGLTNDEAFALMQQLGLTGKAADEVVRTLHDNPSKVAEFINSLRDASGATDSLSRRFFDYVAAYGKVEVAQQSLAKAVLDSLDQTRQSFGVFDQLDAKAKVTADSINQAILAQIRAVTDESANIDRLVKESVPTQLISDLVAKGPEFVAAVAGATDPVREALVANFGRYLDETGQLNTAKIHAGIVAGVNKAESDLSGARGALTAAFGRLFDGPLSVVRDFAGRFGHFLGTLPGTAGAAADGVTAAVRSRFERMTGEAWSVGERTSSNLAGGINSAKAAAEAAAADLARRINVALGGIRQDIPIAIHTIGDVVSSIWNNAGGHALGGPIAAGSWSHDDVPALLEGGEWVLNQSDVRSLGGFGGVQRMLADLHGGGGAGGNLPAAVRQPAGHDGAAMLGELQALRREVSALRRDIAPQPQQTGAAVAVANARFTSMGALSQRTRPAPA